MTEREKMLAGQLYDPSDEELSHLRKRAFQLVERFNRLQKEDAAAQREILQALLGSMGDHVTFGLLFGLTMAAILLWETTAILISTQYF